MTLSTCSLHGYYSRTQNASWRGFEVSTSMLKMYPKFCLECYCWLGRAPIETKFWTCCVSTLLVLENGDGDQWDKMWFRFRRFGPPHAAGMSQTSRDLVIINLNFLPQFRYFKIKWKCRAKKYIHFHFKLVFLLFYSLSITFSFWVYTVTNLKYIYYYIV